MSVMTPILRIRKVLRKLGASPADADEFTDAMSEYPTREEFELRLEAMFARQMVQIILAMLTIVGLGVAVLALLILLVE